MTRSRAPHHHEPDEDLPPLPAERRVPEAADDEVPADPASKGDLQ